MLADAVRVQSVDRREALAGEIRVYADALLRARLGVLQPTPPSSPAVKDAGVSPSAPVPVADGASALDGCDGAVRHAPGSAVSPVVLERFCRLTGVSPSHIGGNGSNLAGIAFYFDAFAILTAGRDVPLERLERLLDQLRACREAIDQFVSHRLRSAGISPAGRRDGERDLHHALRALESAGTLAPPGS